VIHHSPDTEKPAHSVFDIVTKLFVPILAVVAAVLTRGSSASVSLGLIGVAALSLIIGLSPSFKAWLHEIAERKGDQRCSDSAYPELRKFVRRFGAFVDSRTSNTLHHIVLNQHPVERNHELILALGSTDIGMWQGFWHYVSTRIETEQPDIRKLRVALLEFEHLVGNYNSQCVLGVFARLNRTAITALPAETKNELNSFQQRLDHFFTDYETFVDDLCRSRPSLQQAGRHFPHPRPLS
jgi:hypothetical protein